MSEALSWRDGVVGDPTTRLRLGEAAQIADMLVVEAAYSRALGQSGVVRQEVAQAASEAILAAEIDLAKLAREAQEDGMPVPGLVRQLRACLPANLHSALHQGLTSQDVMDTALVLALRDILTRFQEDIDQLLEKLNELQLQFGSVLLMGRTRMQAALLITVGHRLGAWRDPLDRLRAAYDVLSDNLCQVQLGGPVGTRDSLGPQAGEIARALAEALDLRLPARAWHTDRTHLAELSNWLSMVTGALAKMGHDMCLMAQQGIDDIQFDGGGSSSAMAHKKNPVRAETLRALGQYNATLLSGMHLALDHEQERSGAAWTLEWLVLPQMLETTGAALLRAKALLGNVTKLGGSTGEKGGAP